jgi:protein arginine kinase activator
LSIELVMLCQVCNKKTATIHLTEITNGLRNEMHLCEYCAVEQGIAAKSQVSINELLSGLLAVQPSDEEMFGPSEEKKSCPICGFTLDQFRKEAVLGCPNDYEFFENALLPLIEKAHNGKTSHCGKIPSRMPQEAKEQIKLANLQQQLDVAVRKEDYEEAARLRDKIKQLES